MNGDFFSGTLNLQGKRRNRSDELSDRKDQGLRQEGSRDLGSDIRYTSSFKHHYRHYLNAQPHTLVILSVPLPKSTHRPDPSSTAMRYPGIMPTFEPPRDFCERGSHISLPSTESDFHIPDDAERLTLPTRRRTTKRVERIQREIDRLTLTRKIDTNRETTQYLLITNLREMPYVTTF